MGLNGGWVCIENPALAESPSPSRRRGCGPEGDRDRRRSAGCRPPPRRRTRHQVTCTSASRAPAGRSPPPPRAIPAEFLDVVRNLAPSASATACGSARRGGHGRVGARRVAGRRVLATGAIRSRRTGPAVTRAWWTSATCSRAAPSPTAGRRGRRPRLPPGTSVAELLADRGCAVEIITAGMVVGQDLGITLDMETFNVRAHAKGIKQATDLVVLSAPGPTASQAGRAEPAAPPDRGVRAAALRLVVCASTRHRKRPCGSNCGPRPSRCTASATASRRAGARRRDRGTPGGGGDMTVPARTVPADIGVLAVIVVRDGELPAGADETVAEAGGRARAWIGNPRGRGLLDAASRVWLLERSSVALAPWPPRWRPSWRTCPSSCCQPHPMA